MKKEPGTGFWEAIISLLRLISDFLTRNDLKRKQQEINNAKAELAKALAEGRITDSAYWNKRVNQLEAARVLNIIASSKGLVILACLFAAGCITTPHPTPQPMPLVIGERINKVKPGETMVIPKLAPPAKQWYLVDDVGLGEWLGIDPSRK